MSNAVYLKRAHSLRLWSQLSCLHHRKSAACIDLYRHRKLQNEGLYIPATHNAPLPLCQHCQQATATVLLYVHDFCVHMTIWHGHVHMI